MQKENKFNPIKQTYEQLFVHEQSRGMHGSKYRLAVYTHEDARGNKIYCTFGDYYDVYWDASRALTELVSGMKQLNEIVGGNYGLHD